MTASPPAPPAARKEQKDWMTPLVVLLVVFGVGSSLWGQIQANFTGFQKVLLVLLGLCGLMIYNASRRNGGA